MPTYTTTAKHALRKLTGANLVSDVDAGFTALASDLDAIIARADQGPAGSRPTSTGGSPGKLGRFYWATDTKVLSFDYGTGWITAYNNTTTVRGEVNADGTVARGDSFTVAKIAAGQYGLNIMGYFSARPTVVCTVQGIGVIASLWSGTVPLIKTYDSSNSATDLPFSFIATGPTA